MKCPIQLSAGPSFSGQLELQVQDHFVSSRRQPSVIGRIRNGPFELFCGGNTERILDRYLPLTMRFHRKTAFTKFIARFNETDGF